MIIAKDRTWQKLARRCDRVEAVAILIGVNFHNVMLIPRYEFDKLEDVTGLPTHCTLGEDKNFLGFWPKPINYYDVAITAAEIFQL